MKNLLGLLGLGVGGIAALIAVFALVLAFLFGIGWVVGWIVTLIIPAAATWAVSTLGVSFPTLCGTAFVVVRLMLSRGTVST